MSCKTKLSFSAKESIAKIRFFIIHDDLDRVNWCEMGHKLVHSAPLSAPNKALHVSPLSPRAGVLSALSSQAGPGSLVIPSAYDAEKMGEWCSTRPTRPGQTWPDAIIISPELVCGPSRLCPSPWPG